ncbi:MAG: ABC transporter substrate-binding protein [Candidatus Brachytrichaceae bacterium NZ_4S206]|jgi:ABC-type glycerol-3-phosphate transport system substrate-binding protein
MTRKLIPFVAAMAMLMAACAAPAAPAATEAPAPTQAPGTTEAAPAPTEAPAEPATGVDAITLSKDNPTEILFWHRYSGGAQKFVEQFVEKFNAENEFGIKVTVEKIDGSYADLYSKINAAIQGGTPPNIAQAYQNQASFYRLDGNVIDLAPFITSKKYGLTQAEIDDYFAFFLESDKNPQFPGEVLGWPTSRSAAVLYVNLDWLKELGVEEPPKTLAEFEALACKASDPANERYGLAWQNDISNFAALVFANGGRVLSEDAQSYVFNSEAGVESLSLLKRLFENKCAVEIPSAERFGEQTRFAAQKVLFVMASSTGLPFYADAVAKSEKPFRWTYAMFPQKDSSKPVVDIYGASWSVFKSTPEKELASWLFLKAFTEPENIAQWAVASGYMAVRKSAAPKAIETVKSDERYKNFPEAAEAYARLYDMVAFGAVEAPVAGYDPVRKLMSDVVSAVAIKGEGDVKAALDKAVEDANAILKENAPGGY